MFFNSFPFLVFFAVVYLIYWHVPQTWRRYLLILASLFFYGWWDVYFLIHFLAIVVVNYALFVQIRRSRSRALLTVMLVLNLGNLCLFKYGAAMVRLIGGDLGLPPFSQFYDTFNLILPLAISFYSFQIIALSVDAWRGELGEEEIIGPRDYVLFIMFFPQLIAGPIMRHSHFFHQIDNIKFEEQRASSGMILILFGLVKKGYIADNIAAIIDPIFNEPLLYSAEANWVAAAAFPIQVYLDFSGYTDMARGLAKLLGYEIPENFRGPYFASTFAEHWQRWHITLTTWLRDYLYIPLGGSRATPARVQLNVFLTMVLGGLWHGHNFTFLIWGALEGALLVLERVLGLGKWAYRNLATRIAGVLFVFFFLSVIRIWFRVDTIPQGINMYAAMLGQGADAVSNNFPAIYRFLGFALIAHALQYFQSYVAPVVMRQRVWLIPLLVVVVWAIFARLEFPGVSFVYFQF